MKRPAELITGITGSILTLLIAFGIAITDAQAAAVLGVVSWTPFVITLIVDARRKRVAARR